MNRICFSCPGCGKRRKTYIYNEFLDIKCKYCGERFKVCEGKNIRYKQSYKVKKIGYQDVLDMEEEKFCDTEEKECFNAFKFAIYQCLILLLLYYLVKYIRPDIF